MRIADIIIGETYALRHWGGLAKIKVLEKGLPGSGYGKYKRNDRIRFEVLEGQQVPPARSVLSRDIHPWERGHDETLARERKARSDEAEVTRIANRLSITAWLSPGTERVTMRLEDFMDLADRLGVQ